MAEIQESGNKKKGGKNKQKKMTVRVDFTPMVDMNMLLITFFMLCTSLSKPQTMEISMPSKDQVTEAEQTKVKASKAITLLLGEDDKIYYYFGEPDYEHAESLQQTDYSPAGLRDILLERNFDVVRQMKELKLKKLNKEISEDDFKKQAHEPALQQVRMDLAVAALVKAEELEATAEEIEAEMKSVADKYGMDLDTIKKYLPEADVREQVLRSKAIKAVADAAVAVAPVVEETKEEAKQEEEKKDEE